MKVNDVEFEPKEENYSIGDMISIRSGTLETLAMIVQPECGFVQVISLENVIVPMVEQSESI